MSGEGGFEQARHRRQQAVPAIVFGLTLAGTAAGWYLADDFVASRDRLRLHNEARRVESEIRHRLEVHGALLGDGAALFETLGDLGPDDFRHFVDVIRRGARLEGIQGIGYVARVDPSEQSEFERRLSQQYGRPFSIFPRTGREALTIALIEPQDKRNRRATGFNMASEAVRMSTMSRARDSAKSALSPTVHLIQETPETVQPGFLIFVPIYRSGLPSSIGERRRMLRGFVYSPFRAHDFFGSIFDRADYPLRVQIDDIGAKTPKTTLYSNLSPGEAGSALSLEEDFEFGGHRWRIRYVPTSAFAAASGEPLVRTIPIAGVLFAALLAALSYGQVRGNNALVRRTEELHGREFRQRLLARSGVTLASSLDLDESLAALAELAVPSFADWCAVDLWERDGSVRRVALVSSRPEMRRVTDQFEVRYPADLDRPGGVGEVLRTGKPQFLSVVNPEEGSRPASLGTNANRDEPRISSVIIAPMSARGRMVGAISFVWADTDTHYDEDDLALATEIGTRAGLAVENARLYRDRSHEIEVRTSAEARVRELNENLERLVAERTRELTVANQELEAFCYSVSHDLRGPLRSVDGFSKALLEDFGTVLDSEGHHYVERVRNAARRMDELITALLSLSRLTRAERNMERISLSNLARQAVDELLPRGGPAVAVMIQPDLEVTADARMLRIVLDNLLSNAVKFSIGRPEPRIEVGKKDGAFFVRDNGVGFNMAYANKLFLPFERLHAHGEFPGTGIGLATVQRIIARHGGRVWAHGEEGVGATFYFTVADTVLKADVPGTTG